MKKISAKVMWVGRATLLTVGMAVILAVVLGIATTALAAAPGDPFRLGKSNAINKLSTLVGSTANSMLRIDNNGTGTALDLRVEPGNAPMTVDSDERVDNLNADRLDGNDSSKFARAYERTVVVSPVGTPQQNGTALKNAMDGITDASATNPYLLKIEPGVYDVGNPSTPLQMKPYVDVEGSGERVTKITATGSSQNGTVVGAANSELRFLTAENTGGTSGDSSFVRAISTTADPFRVKHVTATATASGGTITTIGVFIDGGTATLSQATISASGPSGGGNFSNGVFVSDGGVATLSEVTVSASGGGDGSRGLGNSGEAEVRNSRLEGGNNTIVTSSGDTTRVGASQLAGGPVGGSGTTTCAGVYDENYAFSASACP